MPDTRMKLPPKRLEILADALRSLSEMARIEGSCEVDLAARKVWREVEDWAAGTARHHGIDEQFLHGAALPENRQHPATDALNARRRPVLPPQPTTDQS